MSFSPTTVLGASQDAMGTAILEYQHTHRASRLRVLSSMFDEDEIPVPYLFRALPEMPPLEQQALDLASGRILDVGGGAGCHAYELQQRGADVLSIDISPLSCQAMQERGIRQVQCVNLFDRRLLGPFDTILMLMNGTGIVGRLKNMPDFLQRIQQLLAPGGQLLIDSSDLRYLYQNDDGTYDIDPLGPYYGEVDYQMVYRKVKGEPFDWLYVDFQTLSMLCQNNSLQCELVAEGEHYDYLARITRK